MTLTYHDGMSVFQVLVYAPLFALALYLWKRDGLGPGSAAWRFSSTFCCLRLTGSICSLVAISIKSEGLQTAILVSQVVGLPPLTLSVITLLDRINAEKKVLPRAVMLGILLISIPALILGIYGADKLLDSSTSIIRTNAYIQAAMATFLVLYVSLIALVILFASKWHDYDNPIHKRVVVAAVLATSALGVKHIDAALEDYGHTAAFAIAGSNTTAYLVMSVLMEMATVGVNLGFGVTYGPPLKIVQDGEADQSGVVTSVVEK